MVKHCAPEWYICGKRFYFLNTYLKETYNLDLASKENENMEINILLSKKEIIESWNNQEYMNKRNEYEYYERNGKTAKRQNYNKD